MDVQLVAGGQQAQVQHVGVHGGAFERGFGDIEKPPGLGDFAGAGAVVAGRAADEQHA
jgi:hypothetical protein